MFFDTDNHEKYGDPDDFFKDTRMSFGEHIEDLRKHLIRAILGFCVALFLSFFIGDKVLAVIAKPVEDQLGEFYQRREERLKQAYITSINEGDPATKPVERQLELKVADLEQIGLVAKDHGAAVSPDGWISVTVRSKPVDDLAQWKKYYDVLGPKPTLRTMSVQEGFVVFFKVCMVTGFVLGSPWIFYQVWAFIAAGLYPHERRYVNVYLPFSLVLFLFGVAICQLFVMAQAVKALLWFNEWLNLEPELRLNEWLGFAMLMPVMFGLAFQTPLVMLFLERIGLGTVEGFRQRRRICYFGMAVAAAVFTPSVDPYSMLLLWVPMCLFYELGIWMCKMSPRDPHSDLDVPEPEEMVEV